MESRLKVLGHPLHPVLIVFPLGLLVTSILFDIIHLISGNGYFSEIAFWMLSAGLIGGLIAGAAGLVDYTAIPAGTRAQTIGKYHAIGNIFVLTFFAIAWVLRVYAPLQHPPIFALLLSLLGFLLSGATAWLGGEMVDRLGIGVDPGAHANAPSSLSHQPAAAQTVRPPADVA
jgi:uncharacterized membrane protein